MKRQSKFHAVLMAATLLFGIAAAVAIAALPGRYGYDQPGDKDFMCNTNVLERWTPTGSNNQSYKIVASRAQVKAMFTATQIVVDGVREAAWSDAVSVPITHKFDAGMTADDPGASAQGTLRLLWDGPVLYVLVEVTGDTTKSDTETQDWNRASYSPNTDGLFVFMDVFNDQWGIETDTQGVFFLSANPGLTSVASFNNNFIPSLGSFFNTNNQDYSTRLKAFKSSGYRDGNGINYTYEFALQIKGWGDEWNRQLTNGTQIGLEVGIFDQALLVATLAPDRAIIIETNLNDFNDGSMTDNMSLQIAKSVYKALGVNGENFVKFNSGNYVLKGDPHGFAPAAVEGKYLSDFFFGTQTLTGAEAQRLNTDPYALKVSNGRTQSPYDYYWGGYNTITGRHNGTAGRDGWYHYRF